MAYGVLLNKMISEKGYNFKEFLDECEKRGKAIDKGNFSKILNGKSKPPKEEISRMFANICNADERLLVLEGYIDTAPKEVKEAFVSLKMIASLFILNSFENSFDKETIDIVKEKFYKEPLADFIISLIDIKDINVMSRLSDIGDLFKESMDKFSILLKEPIGIPVTDNGMFPIVPQNSKINILLQNEYKSGEILAIKIKDTEEMLVRYALFNENKIILNALNNQYETLILNQEDVIILGKVTKVITNV